MLSLQEKIYEKMNTQCNYKEQIIYQNHEISKKNNIETYVVIVKIGSANVSRFRIFKGIKYEDSVSINYFTIEEDMLEAMMGEVESND